MSSPRIALVTAAAARDLDDDLPPLAEALRDASIDFHIVNWDDAGIDWAQFDLAVLRSTWDYTMRLPEFLAWADRVSQSTTLLNPLDVIRWNTDKHYLGDLARAGVPAVPSHFIEPGEDAEAKLERFLQHHHQVSASHAPLSAPAPQDGKTEHTPTPHAGRLTAVETALPAERGRNMEFVVKPSVGAGSRDAQRYGHDERTQALAHAQRLLDAGRSVLLQPYLDRVDAQGETALIYFNGVFSHAIRKGPLLRRGEGPTRALFAAEHIMPRTPGADELRVAEEALAAIPFDKPLLYARVDLIRDGADKPCVLELELTEPSLFFAHGEGAARRFAEAMTKRAP